MHYPKFLSNKLSMGIQMNDIGLLKDFLFRYLRALIIIPIAFEILFLIYEICLVKDNFSSMITHKNFVKVTRSKEMLKAYSLEF